MKNMSRIIVLVFTAAIAAVVVSGETRLANMQAVQSQEAALRAAIAELPAKQNELATTVYYGTIGEVVAQRAADVNAVIVAVKDTTAQAVELAKTMGYSDRQADFIADKIIKTVQLETLQEQKSNNEFLGMIMELPKTVDVNDPNYISTIQSYREMEQFCFDVLQPL